MVWQVISKAASKCCWSNTEQSTDLALHTCLHAPCPPRKSSTCPSPASHTSETASPGRRLRDGFLWATLNSSALPGSKSGIKRRFGEVRHLWDLSLQAGTDNRKKNESVISQRTAIQALKNGKFDAKTEDKGVAQTQKSSLWLQTHQGHLTLAGGLFPLRLSQVCRDSFSPKC